MQGSDELRLAYTIALNVLVFASAYRWVGRIGISKDASGPVDPWQRLADALLLTFLIQYLAVGIPGLVGLLSVVSVSLAALVMCAALWIHALRLRAVLPATGGWFDTEPAWVHWTSMGTALFAGVFLLCVLAAQFNLPVVAEDSLTYHMPAAVQWLTDRRIDLFPTWFFNPANTWSPLAGSMFMAWLIAPMHSELLVRYVQAPALVLVFVGMVQLCRSLGASTLIGLLIATATLASRPFISEAAEVKDDLLVSAFFICAVIACDAQRAKQSLAPWRIGIGAGLMLATKYTAVYELPLLMLLIDAPMRARWKWRQWTIVAGCVVLLAGPWYLRNILTTGNPIFPIEITAFGHRLLPGLLQTRRSMDVRTASGAWTVLTGRYHSVPVILFVLLLLGWAVVAMRAALRERGQVLRQPMMRLCMIGPPIGIGLFLVSSPYPEVRFIFPSLLLLFGCLGWATMSLGRCMGLVAATAGAVIAVVTSFHATYAITVILEISVPVWLGAFAVAYGIAKARAGVPALAGIWRWIGVAGVLIAAMMVYVYWPGFVAYYREDAIPTRQSQLYDDEAEAWQFVREKVAPQTPIAYTNTHLVYPLLGLDYQRRAFYVPVRADISDMRTLPHFPEPLEGEQVTPTATRLLNSQPDSAVWLQRLRESGAGVLFIAAIPDGGTPPELAMAVQRPDHLQIIFSKGGIRVYRIVW